MRGVQFLSDEWLAALDEAARARPSSADDPLRGVHVVIEQVITGGPRWRLVIDDGRCYVVRGGEAEPDVRLTSDRDTALAIATGARAALDAFLAGDLVLGGDVRTLLDRREALEALGDLFAAVRSATVFG